LSPRFTTEPALSIKQSGQTLGTNEPTHTASYRPCQPSEMSDDPAAALASVNAVVNAAREHDEENTRRILATLPPPGKLPPFVLSEEDYRIIALWRRGVQRDCIRKRRKRKPKGMPKRALSAYNVFFKEERVRLLDEFKASEGTDTTDTPRIGFQEMARTIGSRWRNLSEEERKYYNSEAQSDTARYNKEMDAYKARKKKLIATNSAPPAALLSPIPISMPAFAQTANTDASWAGCPDKLGMGLSSVPIKSE